ncbi:titin-like [Haliotis rubra]|uniref:titin-like n=1 Tax=Haliotis rubra TaxID=36100 RepID=UPI001EE5E184|nr:titin-like [Haliotis rubra]
MTEPPGPPESITAADSTANSVTLKWKPPKTDGGLPIKEYIVERRDKKYGSWIKQDVTRGSVLTLEVTRLTEGTPYFFRVFAENEEGIGAPCEMTEPVIPMREPKPPGVPIGPIKFRDIGEDFVTLDWHPPKDPGGIPIIGYKVDVTRDLDTWTEVATTDCGITSVKAKELVPNKKHYFRVFAINRIGNSKPLESEPVVPHRPPGAPGKPVGPIEAMDIEREAVTLTWNPPEDDGGSEITHYLLEKRDVMRAHWSHAEKTSSPTCKAKVKNLTEGTEFYFRVMAVNKMAAGIPLESRPILVKSPFDVPSPPVGPLAISNVTDSTADLEWKPSEDDGGSPILHYASKSVNQDVVYGDVQVQ